MNILIRSHTALRREQLPGGASRLIRNLATALAESDWTVDVLSPASEEAGSVGTPGVNYVEFDYTDPTSSAETILNTCRGIRTYRSHVKRKQFDVILDDISHYPYFPAHFLRPDRCENVVFMHTAFFGAAREFIGPLKGTVIDGIDRSLPWLSQPKIVCAGESTRKRIHKATGYRRTEVLHPTIRSEAFDYRFDPTSSSVLYLGRLGSRKNVSCLLRAWQRVERSVGSDVSLRIAGTGPQEGPLKRLASDIGLQNVEFLGYVDEAEKRRLFSEALLFVLPSKMEGYATTGLEALASGTPVVGADTFGINDYVSHGETGYLFPVDDDE
jgi:glycosyltransferase involved in cell wall biosynthesis